MGLFKEGIHIASIFDDLDDFTPSKPPEPEPAKRTKHRESLTSAEVAKGKRRLADMVDRAFETLQTAMAEADFSVAIKSAQIILDRAGFGPRTTMDINTTTVDLSALSREELAARASQIATTLRANAEAAKTMQTVN